MEKGALSSPLVMHVVDVHGGSRPNFLAVEKARKRTVWEKPTPEQNDQCMSGRGWRQED